MSLREPWRWRRRSRGGRIQDCRTRSGAGLVGCAIVLFRIGGRFREEPIYVGSHIPPHFRDVPDLMDRFLSFIHENWYAARETQLAAYALWRLNWIHPFDEGERTHGQGSGLLHSMCAQCRLLPGDKIVPERIREDRQPYVRALRAADRARDAGNLDVSELESYLARLLQAQMANQP